jgi:hypothetical protein
VTVFRLFCRQAADDDRKFRLIADLFHCHLTDSFGEHFNDPRIVTQKLATRPGPSALEHL